MRCMLFQQTQVEGDKRKAAAAAAAQQQQAAGGGWFGWFRGSPAAKPDEPQELGSQGELSEEEKGHLRQLVTEQEEALDVGELFLPAHCVWSSLPMPVGSCRLHSSQGQWCVCIVSSCISNAFVLPQQARSRRTACACG